MIKVIDRQVIPGAQKRTPYAETNDVKELLDDGLLLLDICGALVMLRPKDPEPLVFTQGTKGEHRYLNANHARVANALLIKHGLRGNTTLAFDYNELCQKNKLNIIRCSSLSALQGGDHE